MKTNKFLLKSMIALSSVAFLISCGDDEAPSLPPIGGYNSADEVAAADLVAYWPLNGNGNESKSNTAPTSVVGTTWTTGVKGQGANLTAGYLDYPTIAALAESPVSGSITVSVWAKLSNTKLVPNGESHISEIFNLSGPVPGNGYLSVLGETHGLTSSDSIQVKGRYETLYNGSQSGGDIVNMIKMETWMIDDNANPNNVLKHVAFPNKIGGEWAHIVYVFNGATAKNEIYVNGVNVSNTPWVQRNGGVTPFNMVYATTIRPIIGARSSFIAGQAAGDAWNKSMTGGVDELRVFKKALIASDIKHLYDLEAAGR
jgi:hypothetical protein